MGNEKTIRKGPNKVAALITYSIALICLLLGLFLPFGNGAEDTVGNMLGLQLPAAINALKIGNLSIATNYDFHYAYPVDFGGKFTLDFGAVLVLLYALVTLMGVIALIPAIVNTVSKKSKKNVALKAASFIEVLAVAVLSCLFFFIIPHALLSDDGLKALNNWSLIAALGGTLLMLIVQAFIYRKKGSGVIKFVLALISAIAFITSLYDITAVLPFLDGKLPDIGNFAYGIYGSEFLGGVVPVQAYTHIPLLFAGMLPEGAKELTLFICSAAIYYVVLANLVFDLMGLGKRTNKILLLLNVIRFALELAIAAVIIIVAAITEGVSIGLLSILIAVLALISLVINIIRFATFKTRKKAKKPQENKESEPAAAAAEAQPAPEATETVKQRKEREKAEKLAAKQAEKEAAEAEAQAQAQARQAETVAAQAAPQQPVPAADNNAAFYTPVIYNGPVDDFIRLLTNEEKIEFARVFIERKNGPLTGVPEYVVGGENDKFFASVFIYFAKIRDLVSDGLMNQLYKQANVMR